MVESTQKVTDVAAHCYVSFDWFGRFTTPNGLRRFPAQILAETPKRYRVKFQNAVGRIYAAGEVALVPQWSCDGVTHNEKLTQDARP